MLYELSFSRKLDFFACTFPNLYIFEISVILESCTSKRDLLYDIIHYMIREIKILILKRVHTLYRSCGAKMHREASPNSRSTIVAAIKQSRKLHTPTAA